MFNLKFSKSEQPTFKNIFYDSEQVMVRDYSKYEIETVKSSRVLSIKQSRRLEVEKKNNMQNL